MGDVLTMLETDHRVVERLLEELSASEPGPEREQLVAKLESSLELHMQFEERELYPLLQRLDAEAEEEAENEHTLARDGLTKLRELLTEPGFAAAVDMLKGGISHHVSDEEEEAFPKLRANVSSDRLGELSTRLLTAKRDANVLDDELAQLTKEQLLEVARQANVEGRSSMSSDELRQAVATTAAT
ncbi:hemerythrin domain-containing protein [Desertimonas flava]|uniref:hemerythrin domain-containing protein n=1 Tax=Desertimonas flava TaxID=2064846 RepID=UPI0013C41FF2|nr:hemerythrin domain-containing protein [Desertimonas flava]